MRKTRNPYMHRDDSRGPARDRRREPDMAEAEALLTDAYTSHGSQSVVSALLWAEYPEIWDTTA